MRSIFDRIFTAIDLGDVLVLAGLTLTIIGVGLWSIAAAFVVAGIELIGVGVLVLRATAPPATPAPGQTPAIVELDEYGRRRPAA